MLIFHKEFSEEGVPHFNIVRECDRALAFERLRNGVVPAHLERMQPVIDDAEFRCKDRWTRLEKIRYPHVTSRKAPCCGAVVPEGFLVCPN